MAFNVSTTESGPKRFRVTETVHESSAPLHQLVVSYFPGHGKHQPWYRVSLHDAEGNGGTKWSRSHGMSYVRGEQSAHVNVPGKNFGYGDATSEHLQQLIAQHHEHPDQWPVLLDALQEEYPQLWDAIEAHRAARRSSEAEQYARAFAEAAK